MSNWTIVKDTKTRKQEAFIQEFWKTRKYLTPTLNRTYTKKRTTAPPKLKQIEASKCRDTKFAELKKTLTSAKSQLDAYNITSWFKHTNFTYLYAELTKSLRKQFEIELCTTAWIKMWEMLHHFLPRPTTPKFKALFLCEAPGSFITCTHHFLQSRYGIDLEWSALTLADQDNTLFDTYFSRWTPNNWSFGFDGTGNIMHPDNIRDLWEQPKVNLVTADGSVSCRHDPNNQELIVTPIKFAEIAAGLGCLQMGGIMIIKFFTVFEPQTICQLWLLASVFETFTLFKPVTSKPGNSEIYVVGRNFQGLDQKYLQKMLRQRATDPLFNPEVVPESFRQFLLTSLRQIVTQQVAVINRNIDYYRHKHKLHGKKMYQAKMFAVNEYIKKYKIDKLNHEGLFI